MSSLSAQVARAHSQWLEPLDPRYTLDDIREKCGEVEKALLNFSEEYCGEVDDTDGAVWALQGITALKNQVERLIEDLQEMEDYQGPDPDYYEEEYE